MTDRTEIETRKLGFKHGGVIYLSDSFALLKDKVLELGAHRRNGIKGTGVDIRKLIEPVDQDALNALAIDYPIVYLDEDGEDLDEPVKEDEVEINYETFKDGFYVVERGPFAGPEIRRVARDGSRHHRDRLDMSELGGRTIGYVFPSELREPTDDETALVLEGLSLYVPPKSAINLAFTQVADAINAIRPVYPATAGEAAEVSNRMAENGDAEGFLLLRDLLKSNEAGWLTMLDAFLAEHRAEPKLDAPDPAWIGGDPSDVIGRTSDGEELSAAVLEATRGTIVGGDIPDPFASSKAARRAKQETKLVRLIGVPKVLLSEFSFETNLERDDDLKRLMQRVAYAWLVEHRTITLSPPQSEAEVENERIPAAGYVTEKGWSK